MFYSQDPQAIRSQFFLSWQKHKQKQSLNALEKQIVNVIELHPEYHPLFNGENLEEFLSKASENSEVFLHLGLHLTIRDQIELNRPLGIMGIYQNLMLKYANNHAVEHLLMEQLQIYLWHSMHAAAQPDENEYLTLCKKIR